jgi:hypothetical protein
MCQLNRTIHQKLGAKDRDCNPSHSHWEISADTLRNNTIQSILESNTLPIAIPGDPFIGAITLVTTSGVDMPKPTKV